MIGLKRITKEDNLYQLTRDLNNAGREMGLSDAWVGTEPDNDAANHLYKSLNPSEIKDFIGYTYKLKPEEN